MKTPETEAPLFIQMDRWFVAGEPRWQNSERSLQYFCCNNKQHLDVETMAVRRAGSGHRTTRKHALEQLHENSSWRSASVAQILADITDSSVNIHFCTRSCMCQEKWKSRSVGQLGCPTGRAGNGLGRHHPCYERSWSNNFPDKGESVNEGAGGESWDG